MPILKEFQCNACDKPFEGFTDICPSCSGAGRRVFRSAFQISYGKAKRTDAILADQFAKRGITNYSNTGVSPKVSWASQPLKTGPRNSGGQPEMGAFYGADALQKVGFQGALQQTLGPGKTVPFQLPADPGLAIRQTGVPIGGKPTELLKRTHTVGAVDIRGKQVVRTK